MKKLLRFFDAHIERMGMSIFCVILFFVVLAGIITRVANRPLFWTEEAARLCYIWMVFLGLSFGTKYDKHIRITILTEKFGEKIDCGFAIFWDIVTIALFVWVSIYAIIYIDYVSVTNTFALGLNQGLCSSVVAIASILNVIRNFHKMFQVHIPAFKAAGTGRKEA